MSNEVHQPHVQIFFESDHFFANALEAIRNAQQEIFLEFYIFEPDEIGFRFLDELERAQVRGVKVFLLIDGIGSRNLIDFLKRSERYQQLHFRIYNPLPFQVTRFRFRFARFFALLGRANRRDHRKRIIVDHDLIFIGSCNLAKVHSRQFMGEAAWRDTSVSLRFGKDSSDIAFMKSNFMDAWTQSRLWRAPLKRLLRLNFLNRETQHSDYFRLNSNRRLRSHNLQDIKSRILNAKKYVLITNAYFIPQRSLFFTLLASAERGVKVILCLPSKSDIWGITYVTRIYYDQLLRAGVQIYEYKKSILHAKTMIVDEWAVIGTHNFNHRSFMHDLEVEAVLKEPEHLQLLADKSEEDLLCSELLTLESLKKRSWFAAKLGEFIYRFRYWL